MEGRLLQADGDPFELRRERDALRARVAVLEAELDEISEDWREDIWDGGNVVQRALDPLVRDFFVREAARVLTTTLKFDEIRRISELRESCGVKSESLSTVNVRRPPRYDPMG